MLLSRLGRHEEVLHIYVRQVCAKPPLAERAQGTCGPTCPYQCQCSSTHSCRCLQWSTLSGKFGRATFSFGMLPRRLRPAVALLLRGSSRTDRWRRRTADEYGRGARVLPRRRVQPNRAHQQASALFMPPSEMESRVGGVRVTAANALTTRCGGPYDGGPYDGGPYDGARPKRRAVFLFPEISPSPCTTSGAALTTPTGKPPPTRS